MNAPEIGFRAPLPEELAPLFPSYQILSLIAKGGMGAVYHAIQTSLDREIAIKILPVEFGDDPEFCKGFEAEAKAMAKLNHPNLISVFDFGEVAGMLFIAMEYVPGQSLYDACNGSAIDPVEVIRLMTGISMGLAHAHQHGILHRDIKPANILLDAHLQPKIGDFGLARHLGTQVQDGDAIFGTPGYTAPEVVERPLSVDQRADVFSLGVLLHELLTGRLPGSDPRSPSAITRCDSRFDEVVSKATHPDPILRYQNAAEIADALQKIASTMGPLAVRKASPVASKAPVARRYSRKPTKKKGNELLVTPVVVPVLIVGIVAVYFFRDQISPKTDSNPKPAPVVVHPPEPMIPTSVMHQPNPVEPEPGPLVSIPKRIEPDPVATVTEPEEPKLSPAISEPGTEPSGSGAVTSTQPKYDVEGFLAHARSVMAGRCGSDVAKRDVALKNNISDFRNDAWKLLKGNLPENFHAAAGRELDECMDELKANGNRMGKGLKSPLKHKKYLVDLYKEFQMKETKIEEESSSVLAEPQKTYLYGLSIKLKALQEANDPAAANLIQTEIDNVGVIQNYFLRLMREAKMD